MLRCLRLTRFEASRLLCALASAFALSSAFAPFEQAAAGWFALIPLIVCSFFSTFWQAFRMGWVSGTVFWLATLPWLLKLIESDVYGLSPVLYIGGYVLLSCFLGLYTAVFCSLIKVFLSRTGVLDWTLNIGWVLSIPLIWVGLEYVRGTFIFGGFPWCQVGVSQYANIMLIQCASIGGVYAVSFVVVCMNTAIAMVVLRRIELYRTRAQSRFHPELMVGLSVLAFAALSGRGMMVRESTVGQGETVRIAAVEPEVTADKWRDVDANDVRLMYEDLALRTASAAIPTDPDLVIWPETALLWVDDPIAEGMLAEVGKLRYPILFGALQAKPLGNGSYEQFNSVFLFEPSQGIRQEYSKRHLVPFGEYLPMRGLFSLIGLDTSLAPPCTPGETNTVFHVQDNNVSLSSLICFEDTVAGLARESVNNGARLLVVQTNDAWFEGSALLKQHMVHAVFRAVENRVPLVRVGNTGISCRVDRFGHVRATDFPSARDVPVEERHGEIIYWDVQGAPADLAPTFYRRIGDLPVAVVGWCSLVVFVLAMIMQRTNDGMKPEVLSDTKVSTQQEKVADD